MRPSQALARLLAELGGIGEPVAVVILHPALAATGLLLRRDGRPHVVLWHDGRVEEIRRSRLGYMSGGLPSAVPYPRRLRRLSRSALQRRARARPRPGCRHLACQHYSPVGTCRRTRGC